LLNEELSSWHYPLQPQQQWLQSLDSY